eukprot:CAMPEP_0203769232 /NCGR_PEP_ID=MMETSP0099_2-20121227/2069_1 /ASSEMBLY_ACC=CAM_ASM_000209 /TAXON_ID=96639 /ORGANISM=" , Strain NY0313808BC1" /LENGTH=64 /DNA_ID=CAMNT_0050666091 /DNA_START=478 /DNA_END=669 /DNA_ORIENTATION=+
MIGTTHTKLIYFFKLQSEIFHDGRFPDAVFAFSAGVSDTADTKNVQKSPPFTIITPTGFRFDAI